MIVSVSTTTSSRFKDTRAYDDRDGQGPVFGLMEPPVEFADLDLSLADKHRVKAYEVGFLDLIAAQYYDFGYESYWWAIALVNGIVDPDTDMYVGQEIYIPPFAAIRGFAQRSRSV